MQNTLKKLQMTDKIDFEQHLLGSIDFYLSSIAAIKDCSDDNFLNACEDLASKILIANKVVLTGIGKSEIVSNRFVALLNSFGIVAINMDLLNGPHGDFGVIQKDDLVIYISNSGDKTHTSELENFTKEISCEMFTVTRNQLLQTKQNHINLPYTPEVNSDLNAPTSSSCAMTVFLDIIALYCAKKSGLTSRQYYSFHPGGKIGEYHSKDK